MTAGYNLGVYRMQVIGRDRAIVRWLPMRGGAAHHRQWQARNEEMPVAVVVGADPATLLAAVMPAPESVTELALAGMIGGRRAALAPCASMPLHVPASAEIVLEGTVSPHETAIEGPFGDHTGYYNAPAPYPVFTLKRIFLREDVHHRRPSPPVRRTSPRFWGGSDDAVQPPLRQHCPRSSTYGCRRKCSYRIAVIAIAKRYAGQARRVMMGFWSLLPQFSMTVVVVVDADIDIRSWPDVAWALATRMDPSRDLMFFEHPVDQLDPASPLPGWGRL